MVEELKINSIVEDKIAVITLEGYINMETSRDLHESMYDIQKQEEILKFIFEIDNLEYVSSAGIAFFIDLFDRYRSKGGKICFVNMKPEIKRVFSLVGFMQFFGDAKSIDEAKKLVS